MTSLQHALFTLSEHYPDQRATGGMVSSRQFLSPQLLTSDPPSIDVLAHFPVGFAVSGAGRSPVPRRFPALTIGRLGSLPALDQLDFVAVRILDEGDNV